jgi:hypothetical protein
MAKFSTRKPMMAAPKAEAMPAAKAPTGKKMPERGERTATNKRTSDARHPASHDAWEKMGSD